VSIGIYWQNVDGSKRYATAVDKNYSLARLWPIGDSSFPLLQYIDPYGYTFFNGAQMPQLIQEVERLIGLATSDEQIEALRGVLDLAAQCKKKSHTFLRFVGD
jgi:hypothetical protein